IREPRRRRDGPANDAQQIGANAVLSAIRVHSVASQAFRGAQFAPQRYARRCEGDDVTIGPHDEVALHSLLDIAHGQAEPNRRSVENATVLDSHAPQRTILERADHEITTPQRKGVTADLDQVRDTDARRPREERRVVALMRTLVLVERPYVAAVVRSERDAWPAV